MPEGQGILDFLPPAPAKPRQLGTTVEAVIYCEAPVATTLHRAVASALDWSMVLLGLRRSFCSGSTCWAASSILTKSNVTVFGAMFLLVGFTYGLLFAWTGAETPGMHWTQLRLTTFDGFPPDRRQRLVRFCRLLPEPLYAAWSALVAGRRRKPGMARPHLAHLPDSARLAHAGFPRGIIEAEK